MNVEDHAVFGPIKMALKIIGCYPGITNMTGFLIIVVSITANIPFQVWRTIETFGDLDALIKCMGPLSITINAVLKLTVFRLSYGHITYLVKEIINDFVNCKEEDEKVVMVKNIKIASVICKVMVISYYGYIIGSILMVTSSCLKAKSVVDEDYLFPASYSFISKTLPNYLLLNVIHLIIMIFSGNVHLLTECFLALLVFHAATKAHGVRTAIKCYSESCGNRINQNDTRNAAKYLFDKHKNYLAFANNIENAYSYVVLIQLSILTIQMCTIGYVLMSGFENNSMSVQFVLNIDFLLDDIFGAGIYCAAGEYFLNQSEHIYQDLVDCAWYEFERKNAKEMLILFIKTQKPVVITSGKFNNLCLVTFTSLMKMSFSYLSMIRATKAKELSNE